MRRLSLKVVILPCDACGEESETVMGKFEDRITYSGNYCKNESHRRPANFDDLKKVME